MKKIFLAALALVVPTVAFAMATLSETTMTQTEEQGFDQYQNIAQVKDITITQGESTDRITHEGDIRIVIPADFPAIWDRNYKGVSAYGTAVDHGRLSDNERVQFTTDAKVAIIPVRQDFAKGEVVTISGLYMKGFWDETEGSSHLGLALSGDNEVITKSNRDIYIRSTHDKNNNVPEPPQGITAEVNQYNKVVLSWVDSPDEDVNMYEIYRKAPGKADTLLAQVLSGVQTYTDEEVITPKTYEYSFLATDGRNQSELTPALPVEVVAGNIYSPVKLLSAQSLDGNTVELKFNKDIKPGVVGTTGFSIESVTVPSLKINKVEIDGESVTLTTDAQKQEIYTLTVLENIISVNNEQFDATTAIVDFMGTGLPTFEIENAVATDSTHVRVTFTYPYTQVMSDMSKVIVNGLEKKSVQEVSNTEIIIETSEQTRKSIYSVQLDSHLTDTNEVIIPQNQAPVIFYGYEGAGNAVVCTSEYAPVCGADGKTYSNSCMAEKVAKTTIAHTGTCDEAPVACTLEYAPVCGVDGVTYSNRCMAESGAKVEVDYEGECKTTPVACTADYTPVCGVDAKTYSNACNADAAKVEISHKGECATVIKNFSDVDTTDWAYSYINRLVSLGVIGGYDDDTFRGENTINRAELLKIALLTFDYNVSSNVNQMPFTDTPLAAWYTPYASTAKLQRIAEGYPDGTLKPAQDITRAEALAVLLRSAKAPYADADMSVLSRYSDVSASDWYAPYVAYATETEISTGYPDGTFRPDAPISREEVVKMASLILDTQN